MAFKQLLSKLLGGSAHKKTTVSAPREHLLHAGEHPVVPFELVLEEHQSSYFYNHHQDPMKGIHQAGSYPQDPEQIPASRYMVINRVLDEHFAWDFVHPLGDLVARFQAKLVARVVDAESLAYAFSHQDHANPRSYIEHRLQKICEQCLSKPSLYDYQNEATKIKDYFVQNLHMAMKEVGVELENIVLDIQLVPRRPAANNEGYVSGTTLAQPYVAPNHAMPAVEKLGSNPTAKISTPETLAAVPMNPLSHQAEVAMSSGQEEDLYYYLYEGKRHGPLLQSELLKKIRSRELDSTTCVWKKGMGQWMPAYKQFHLSNFH